MTSATPYTNATEHGPDTRSSLFLPSYETLQQYETFGTVVSSAYSCLELIPRIVALCQRRQAEIASDECSPESWEEFRQIIDHIDVLQTVCYPLNTNLTEESPDVLVSAVYCHALTIFTYDAMWSGSIFQNPDRLSVVHGHAMAALAVFPSLLATRQVSILLWPCTIVGSCLLHDRDRDQLRALMSQEHQYIPTVRKVQNALELLWSKMNDIYYGPYGLQKLMSSHQFVLCVA